MCVFGCVVGIYIGRDAFLISVDSLYASNGGISATGKNEGGGGIASADGRVDIQGCTFLNNTAVVGGAILADRSSSVAIASTLFSGNTADQLGGAIATAVTATVTIEENSSFMHNEAENGGSIAAADSSNVTLIGAAFSANRALLSGGGLYITNHVTITLVLSTFDRNAATFGGAIYVKTANAATFSGSHFTSNAASSRGGAFYYESLSNLSTTEITCEANTAPSGGCIFWRTYADSAAPVNPCAACVMNNNSLYDVATNTRDVQVMWWPSVVYSGIAALEPPDEESFKPLDPLNRSISASRLVWPRLKATDLYGQIEVLDTETECIVTPLTGSNPNSSRLDFKPHDYIAAVAGVILYEDATFKMKPTNEIHELQMTCELPRREKVISFSHNVNVLPCEPGYSTDAE